MRALEALLGLADAMRERVQPIHRTDLFGRDVLRRGGLAEHAADAAIDRAHQRRAQRTLDVAEQDHARLVRAVLGPMHVGLVEQHVLAVAPRVRLAVDEDAAVIGVRCREPEVVAQ